MKRVAAGLLVVLCTASFVYGGGEGEGSSSSSMDELVVANQFVQEGRDPDSPQEMYDWRDYVIEETEQITGLKVKWVHHTPGEEHRRLLRIKLESSNPPEVISTWGGIRASEFISNGEAADITDLAQELVEKGQMNPALLEGWSRDGKCYGIPVRITTRYMFYDADYFAENGYEVPETWEDLLETAEQIKKNDPEKIPISFGMQDRWPVQHYMGLMNYFYVGPQIYKDGELRSSESELFTDEGYVTAIESFLTLVPYFNPGFLSTQYSASQALFEAGQAAMFYDGAWNLGKYYADGQERNFGQFTLPKPPNPTFDVNARFGFTSGFMAINGNENLDAARTVLEIMGSTEAANLLVLSKNASPNPETIKSLDDEVTRQLVADIAAAEAIVTPTDLTMDDVVDKTYTDGIEAILAGQKTPEQVMAEVREAALARKAELGL